MYDASKIVAGLAVFVVLATSPLATEFMRANHMDLLDQWRDTVVRDDIRTYTSELSGKTYNMSLSDTCLDCHSQKDQFCDACHTYSAVDPYCWDCHVIPEEAQ